MSWSLQDEEQIVARGNSLAAVEQQLELFRQGLPHAQLVAPCTLMHGIEKLSVAQEEIYIKSYSQAQKMGRCMKFIPASGAASRMFKVLLDFYEQSEDPSLSSQLTDFFEKLPQLACYEDLVQSLKSQGHSLTYLQQNKEYHKILQSLLFEEGLNYANSPKGLLIFHRYPNERRSAFAEHLLEAIPYIHDSSRICRLHFTISLEHEHRIKAHFAEISSLYEKLHSGDDKIHFNVNFSFQSPITDTIAVDFNNQPFRDSEGKILFWPSGHGALLKNLSELNGDIVFIKNIDNVVVDAWKPEITRSQRILGGVLVEEQQKVFSYLKRLESKEISEDILQVMQNFAEKRLGISKPDNILNFKEIIRWLTKIFHRPLRVCGMVKNNGESGGGPFWVRMLDGSITKQIVEAAQIDLADLQQREIFKQAAYFNPVQLVCGLKDHWDKPYNLEGFVDPQTAFISQKFKDGCQFKTLELPGLWNGAMAYWNTIFVEVPLHTFHPVKTIEDLFRPAHQVI